MAYFGHIISKHRKLSNLTQAELASRLFVSPQAVSKWENNQAEPDLDTVKKIAEIFNISLNQFFQEEQSINEATTPEVTTAGEVTCQMCGNGVNSEKLINYDASLVCQKCFDKLSNENQFLTSLETEKTQRVSKNILRPFFIGLVLFVIITIFSVISNYQRDESLIENIIISIFISLFFSSFITQMLYDSWLRGFFGNFVGITFRMPGIIFELSIDGLVFLILAKVGLGLLSILLSLLVIAFGGAISILLAPFSIIFEIIIKTKEYKAWNSNKKLSN